MARKKTEAQRQFDHDAQDLLASLGIQPMTIDEIMAKYGRSFRNSRKLMARARSIGRANGIVIDRPVGEDGWLYRARWEWDGSQRPNWTVMLNDLFSRTNNIREDLASYAANATAEGNADLADALEDIHDLFKVAGRSVVKARLMVP